MFGELFTQFMFNLTNEINVLLVLRKLFEVLPGHPTNLGKAYVISSILAKECVEKQEAFNKSLTEKNLVYLDYFKSFFAYIAQSMPLNSLFFSEDASQIIADAIADIVRDSSVGDAFLPNIVGGDELMQKFLSQITIWGTGRCYNYAALALYHLLEEGVRPVDVLWLNDPSPSQINQDQHRGHMIVVVGLLENDYKNIAQSDATVLDFWSGTVTPACDFFKKGAPFHGFNASIIQCYRIKKGEENPFKKPIESEEIKKFKEATSIAIMNITHERKKMEYIPEFKLNEILLQQSRDSCADVYDLEFKNRTSSIKQSFLKLGIFERSANKIQRKFREHKQSNASFKQPESTENDKKKSRDADQHRP